MKDNFWEKASADYEDFATKIPSDIPAYAAVHELLKIEDKRVLDFGCYRGKSSKKILEKGANNVVGVDKAEKHIQKAGKAYKDTENMRFSHTGETEEISEDVFDSVSMTFVHPTISEKTLLSYQFKKIYDCLSENGNVVLLGLHPNSFEKEFRFYKHEGPAEKKDGAPFQNRLRMPEGEVISFTDYFWKTQTIENMLKDIGFQTKRYPLTKNLDGSVGKVLLENINRFELEWKEEWEAPLYQVIEGIK